MNKRVSVAFKNRVGKEVVTMGTFIGHILIFVFRLIIEQSDKALDMYHFYARMTYSLQRTNNQTSKNSLNLPMVEVPVLLEAQDDFLDNHNARTDREIAFRQLQYVHFKEFMKTYFEKSKVFDINYLII